LEAVKEKRVGYQKKKGLPGRVLAREGNKEYKKVRINKSEVIDSIITYKSYFVTGAGNSVKHS
jgi:hypothetical protein